MVVVFLLYYADSQLQLEVSSLLLESHIPDHVRSLDTKHAGSVDMALLETKDRSSLVILLKSVGAHTGALKPP